MKKQNLNKQVILMSIFIVASIVFCRISPVIILPLYVFAGVILALSGKLGWALIYFALMPFFAELSGAVLPKAGLSVGLSLRAGPLLIGLVLAFLGAMRHGRHRLPLIGILPFLMAATISSVDGWVPRVSYMKLLNFSVFLLGIWFGTQNLQHRPKDVFLLRSFFLACVVVVVFGSIALIPFPSISYATSLSSALREGGAELAEAVFQEIRLRDAAALFCGITNHSQTLAGLLACFFPLVMCDMLFVERRFCRLHTSLLVGMLPLIYMTRSRMALVAFLAALFVITLYTSRHVFIPVQVRGRLKQGVLAFLSILALIAIVMELHGGLMGRWLRKSSKDERDERSLGEALTSSRMGLIEYSLWEFRRKPFIGSGFQVAEYTQDQVGKRGFVFSAPIEKGVLPVMVLGETGILGEACFLLFLLTFYITSARRRYFVTITMFTVLLVTNLAEATFFSPGGSGGVMWMFCVVGGFAIDTLLLYRQSIQAKWQQMDITVARPMWGIDVASPEVRRIKRFGMRRLAVRK